MSEMYYAFDLRDPITEEGYSIYRCSECRALVESSHAVDHTHWHEALNKRTPVYGWADES